MWCFFGVILMAVIVGFGCNASTEGNANQAAPKDWKIEIETTGGFSGDGIGNVSLLSDGQARATDGSRACRGNLSAEELEKLGRLIKQARPGSWKSSYQRAGNPHGAADQINYAFRFTTGADSGAKTHETSWYDETGRTLPGDLRALMEAAWAIRERLVKNCVA